MSSAGGGLIAIVLVVLGMLVLLVAAALIVGIVLLMRGRGGDARRADGRTPGTGGATPTRAPDPHGSSAVRGPGDGPPGTER